MEGKTGINGERKIPPPPLQLVSRDGERLGFVPMASLIYTLVKMICNSKCKGLIRSQEFESSVTTNWEIVPGGFDFSIRLTVLTNSKEGQYELEVYDLNAEFVQEVRDGYNKLQSN